VRVAIALSAAAENTATIPSAPCWCCRRLRVPSREVFKYAQNGSGVTVIGPILAEESIPIVKTYFDKKVVEEANRCRIAFHSETTKTNR
jgi:hypothetical protein